MEQDFVTTGYILLEMRCCQCVNTGPSLESGLDEPWPTDVVFMLIYTVYYTQLFYFM